MEILTWVSNLITIIISSVSLFYSIKNLKANKAGLIYLVLYFLFVVPLILDNFYSLPIYEITHYYGYTACRDNVATCLIYDLIIIIIAVANYYLIVVKYKEINKSESKLNQKAKVIIKTILVGCSICAPLLFFVFGILFRYNPLIIFNVGWRYDYDLGKLPELVGYGAIERITYIGCVCSCVLLVNHDYNGLVSLVKNKKINFNLILKNVGLLLVYLIALLLNVLCEGKRSIFLFVGLVALIAFVCRFLGKIKTWKMLLTFAVILIIVIPTYIFLSNNFRNNSTLDSAQYTAMRIDMFRDQSLKYVIYNSIYTKEFPIISFPFQSYITEFFFLFPLVYFPVSIKCGYETYLTASIGYEEIWELGLTRYTNSGLDELYANFSFFGVILFLAILWFVYSRMSCGGVSEQIITASTFVLFIMYTTSYICWFYQFVICLFIIMKVLMKQSKYLCLSKKTKGSMYESINI